MQAIAAGLGIKGARRLRKGELIEAIRGGGSPSASASSGAPQQRSARTSAAAPREDAAARVRTAGPVEEPAPQADAEGASSRGRSRSRSRDQRDQGEGERPGALGIELPDRGDGGRETRTAREMPRRVESVVTTRAATSPVVTRSRRDDSRRQEDGREDRRGNQQGGNQGGGNQRRRLEDIELPDRSGEDDEDQDRSGDRDDDRRGRSRNRNRSRDRKRRGRGGQNDQGWPAGRQPGRPAGGTQGNQGTRNDQQDDYGVRDGDELMAIAGILDIRDNNAYVRTTGYLPGPSDVFVTMNQVKRHACVRKGDAITGQVKAPREGRGAPRRASAAARRRP
ncbi:Rho termination factor N-terminal domain-containing protein [Brachybacterium sacelli]|uniref:Rho termination factor N-terminal domain-containing protein n=1 Tax=Brachybacterium sacelli TaxID=173364 RepID=UPI00361F3ADB